MSRRAWRWTGAVVAALAAFGACFGGLAGTGMDAGLAVGLAAIPFTVVLTVAGAWAERARTGDGGPAAASAAGSPYGQAVGQVQGINIGPGSVVHVVRDPAPGGGLAGGGEPEGTVVVGDVPQEPAAFQPRPDAGTATPLMRLGGTAMWLLNELGDSLGQMIRLGEALVADCERVLGVDHPLTLMSRNNLDVPQQPRHRLPCGGTAGRGNQPVRAHPGR